MVFCIRIKANDINCLAVSQLLSEFSARIRVGSFYLVGGGSERVTPGVNLHTGQYILALIRHTDGGQELALFLLRQRLRQDKLGLNWLCFGILLALIGFELALIGFELALIGFDWL